MLRAVMRLLCLCIGLCAQVLGAEVGNEWKDLAFPQAASPGMQAWFVLPTKMVLDDASLPKAPEPAKFTLKGGRGEHECAQLVVRPDADLKGVSVVLTDLTGKDGRIPPSAWCANKVGTVDLKVSSGRNTLRQKGLVPDPLLPDPTFDLRGGVNNIVWLTVFVPKDAPPGLYEGRIQLRQGERVVLEAPVSLQVWSFTLPDETHLVIMANVWTNGNWFERYTKASLWGCLRPYCDNLKAHRINATASVYPIAGAGEQGYWSPEGPPSGLAEYERALRYVLDDLGFVRFRFPPGASRREAFQVAPPREGIWMTGGDFVRSDPPPQPPGVWRRAGGASLAKPPRRMKEAWVEYDFEAKTPASSYVWLQVEAVQDTEKKTVFLDGAEIGALTSADFREHPLRFARLPNKIAVQAGKHTLRVKLSDIAGVSDPLCAIFLTAEEEADLDRLVRETVVLTEEFKSAFRYHAEHAAAFFRERGWLGKAQMKLKDEPTRGEYGRVAAVYEYARELLPEVKRELSEEPSPILWRGVNVWTPYYTHFDPAACAERQKAGDEVWLYCNDLHGIGYPPGGVRLIPWFLWRYHLDGYLFWSVNYWTDDPWEPRRPDNNFSMRGTLLYPNPKDGTPINSIRWEVFREGLEDFETLRLLQEKVNELRRAGGSNENLQQAEALLNRDVQELVRTVTDFTWDPLALVRLRDKAGETLSALNSPRR